jgi:hypothetical protein
LARFREAERPELLRPVDFRLLDFRALDLLPPDREDFRALLRAELRPPRLADLPDFLADRRALFLAPLRADFLAAPFAERLADFLRDRPPDLAVPPVLRLGAGSSRSKDDEDDAGEGEGVLSEGSGSIHPEPDQPISI